MVVTDKTELHQELEPGFFKNMIAFDASGRRLTVDVGGGAASIREGGNAAMEPEELKSRIAQFWQTSGSPIAGMEGMELGQTVEQTIHLLKEKEWKTYRRGGHLFWTLMWPSALIPFIIGFFKLPMQPTAQCIYSACFVAAMLTIAALRRMLYAKPRFPDPGKKTA